MYKEFSNIEITKASENQYLCKLLISKRIFYVKLENPSFTLKFTNNIYEFIPDNLCQELFPDVLKNTVSFDKEELSSFFIYLLEEIYNYYTKS